MSDTNDNESTVEDAKETYVTNVNYSLSKWQEFKLHIHRHRQLYIVGAIAFIAGTKVRRNTTFNVTHNDFKVDVDREAVEAAAVQAQKNIFDEFFGNRK